MDAVGVRVAAAIVNSSRTLSSRFSTWANMLEIKAALSKASTRIPYGLKDSGKKSDRPIGLFESLIIFTKDIVKDESLEGPLSAYSPAWQFQKKKLYEKQATQCQEV